MLKKLFPLLIWLLAIPVAAKPLIAASIRPLALIAEEMSAGVAEVTQILPDGDVPHHYSMGFTDRKQILEADLVLWVGPKLESFYARAINARPANSVIGMADLVQSPGGINVDSSLDPHLWLNPQYGLLFAEALRGWLIQNYPESVDRVEANYAGFRNRLQKVDEELSRELEPISDRRYVAGHGALVHFANYFGLIQVAAMQRSSGVSASMQELSDLLREQQIKCFIVEPQYRQQRAEKMAEYLQARIRVVDPLGVAIDKAPGAYAQLIGGVGWAFVECLAGREAAD